MRLLMTLFYLVALILMGTFAFLNPIKVHVDYYWGTVDWPVGMIVVIAFALGCWLGLIMGSLKGRSVMKRKMMNKFAKMSSMQDPKEKN
jgi:uncharacterized integral membrane protein